MVNIFLVDDLLTLKLFVQLIITYFGVIRVHHIAPILSFLFRTPSTSVNTHIRTWYVILYLVN